MVQIMNITSIEFCDKNGMLKNNSSEFDKRSYNSKKYLAISCSDGTKFYISHDINTEGTIFKYNFYIGDVHTKLIDKHIQYNITKSATELWSRFHNGTLFQTIYEPYIASAYDGYCSCYTAAVPLTERGIKYFIEEFKQNNTNGKNFFSIILCSGDRPHEQPHVSTLIVDCRSDNYNRNNLYLLDTSNGIHHAELDSNGNLVNKYIKTNKQIHYLNTLENTPLQKGNSCTTWATITNIKLAQYINIDDAIDTVHSCMQPRFFQEVTDGVINISKDFIDTQARDILKTQIFNKQNIPQITKKDNKLIQDTVDNQNRQQTVQQQEQPAQNIQNQPLRSNYGQHIGIEQNQQDKFDRILDNIQENRTSLRDTQNQRTQTKQQKKYKKQKHM